MNTKNNARFRETETRMEAAALALMRAGAKVTVRAVCERAEVNRSTFYAHFLDIPDMLGKMEAHLHRELLKDYAGQDITMLSAASFVPFLRHVRSHAYFYGVALHERRDFPLRQGYDELLGRVVRPLCEAAGITDEEGVVRMLVFFQAGFTMVLRRWVDRGCAESEEQVAATLAACVPTAWVAADPGGRRYFERLGEEALEESHGQVST